MTSRTSSPLQPPATSQATQLPAARTAVRTPSRTPSMISEAGSDVDVLLGASRRPGGARRAPSPSEGAVPQAVQQQPGPGPLRSVVLRVPPAQSAPTPGAPSEASGAANAQRPDGDADAAAPAVRGPSEASVQEAQEYVWENPDHQGVFVAPKNMVRPSSRAPGAGPALRIDGGPRPLEPLQHREGMSRAPWKRRWLWLVTAALTAWVVVRVLWRRLGGGPHWPLR